jgi:hypothetical protein
VGRYTGVSRKEKKKKRPGGGGGSGRVEDVAQDSRPSGED